jgi:hypothetical protein
VKYDIVVIGAGAAGVMACHAAMQNNSAESTSRILLLEKERAPLRKLKISGKGRCNLTTGISPSLFSERLGKGGRFLHSAFSRFSNQQTIEFFNSLGVEFKLERGERYFPVSDSAYETAVAFFTPLEKSPLIDMRFDCPVSKITKNEKGEFVIDSEKGVFEAKKLICAPGGLSYTATGSDGSLWPLLTKLGHKVLPPRQALCGMKTCDNELLPLAGLSLRNINVALLIGEKKADEEFGEFLFTGDGVSGPIVFRLSRTQRDLFTESGDVDPKSPLSLSIDLKPALSREKLDQRILRDLAATPNRKITNVLGQLLPRSLMEIIYQRCDIDVDGRTSEFPKKQRNKLLQELKDFRIPLRKLCGWDESIITIGGIHLKEVNPRTMESTLCSGLYFAGEVLNLDGPTGGFNLQIAFTSGYQAGLSAMDSLEKS